ncbi:hypothetical protein CEP50_15305 [Actinopolyspora mortivallis]|uniref:Uncharacterized protein n=1 Tax=Actinopolyspora mortivallis TaxID=33906 RepID=A0A2T0GTS5_ACTMO|nr:hypothetical protein CEP50_15305 [Actinopolyspora mortivallis]
MLLSRISREKITTCLLCGFWLFFFLALLDYSWGLWNQFAGLDVAETCLLFAPYDSYRGGGFERIDYGMFPPSAECVWTSGNTSDLVPGYVAPLLYVFLSGALLCLLTAVWFRKRGTPTPAGEQGGNEAAR